MKHFILFLSVSVYLFSCKENSAPEQMSSPSFDSSYKPAVFTDGGRMEKIMQAFPIIDKIFKGYADSNHLAGVAFGLVVDGKLVYKNNFGYTDIQKKLPVTSSSLFRIASMSKSFAAMSILK